MPTRAPSPTPLEVLTTSDDDLARLSAAEALSAEGAPAIPVLITALADESVPVRVAIVEALGRLGQASPSARRTVYSVLARTAQSDPEGRVRAASSAGLAGLSQPVEESALTPAEVFRARVEAAGREELLDLVIEHAATLSGKPLQRANLVVIARALERAPVRARLAPLLAAATSRDEALRVLRLARRAGELRRKAGARGAASASALDARPDHARRPTADLHHDDFWDDYFDDSDFDLVWKVHLARRGTLLPPQLDPWSHVELHMRERVDLALRGRDRGPAIASLGAHLPAATVAALRRKIGLPSALPQRVLELIERFSLPRWSAVEGPRATDTPFPVPRRLTHPAELAIVSHLEEESFFPRPPHHIDWDALLPALSEMLAQGPQDPLEEDAAIRAAVTTALRGSAPHLWQLAEALRRADARYLPLHCLLGLRTPHGRAFAFARFDEGLGSALVPRLIHANLDDTARLPASALLEHAPEARADVLRELLVAGGGSLRHMPYPEIRLICRQTLLPVDDYTHGRLAELAGELTALHEAIATAPAEEMLAMLLGADPRRQPPDRAVIAELATDLLRDAVAHAMLRSRGFFGERVRIRRKHVRTFLARAAAPGEPPIPGSIEALRAAVDLDLVKESLAAALLDRLHSPDPGKPVAHALKEALIAAARAVAVTYRWADGAPPAPPPRAPDDPPESNYHIPGERLVHGLTWRMGNAPLALCDALDIPHQQGIPHLQGGERLPMEQAFSRLTRGIQWSWASDPDGRGREILLRPLPKLRALGRGAIGGDCSTDQVPFRALSPHHTYYELFENGEPHGGYVTVYEAWAHLESAKLPVLCLETVNVPGGVLDGSLRDLVSVLESVAVLRGLHPRLVVITGIGTYNYQAQNILARMRRFRRGTPVRLSPADPALWSIYAMSSGEADRYSAFRPDPIDSVRLLAPADSTRDHLQPENVAEIARIAEQPPSSIRITGNKGGEVAAFISGWPSALP
ncbi:MAG: HEAT repeat domain-containing protein [Polyangiaceae bacterium]